MDFVLLGDDTLTQWALIAGGVAIAGLFLYLYLDAQRLRKNGVSLRAWIVQAHDALYSPGGDDRPSLLILSLPGERQASDEKLAKLAEWMFKLRAATRPRGAEATVQKLCLDERFRPGFQTLLPREFTGGSEVHCVHMEIRRYYLSAGGVLKKPYVRVAALRTNNPGKIEWIMIPYRKP